DDGSFVWIGDDAVDDRFTTSNALIKNGGIHGLQTVAATKDLVAGTYYPLRIQFSDSYGNDNMVFSFKSPAPGSQPTSDGQGYFYQVEFADDAPFDTGQLTYEWKVTTITGRAIANGADKSFEFTPEFAGSYLVTKKTIDPQGAVDEDSFSLEVKPRFQLTTGHVNGVSFDSPLGADKDGTLVPLGTIDQLDEGDVLTFDLESLAGAPSVNAKRTYEWGIETYDDEGFNNVLARGTDAIVRVVPPDNDSYTLFTLVYDTFGEGAQAQQFYSRRDIALDVVNAPPTVALSTLTASTTVGLYTLGGITISDPGASDVHTLTVSWGDGKTDKGLDPLAPIFHTYTTPGIHNVVVTATDDDGGASEPATLQLTVTAVAPTVTIADIVPINDGQSVTFAANVHYVGAKAQNETITWEVIAPDGNSQSRGTNTTFVPNLSGTWLAIVTVDDGRGNVVKAKRSFVVNNLAPTGLTLTEATSTLNDPVRTYSGQVTDFTGDRPQGSLIVENAIAGTSRKIPLMLMQDGQADANGLQTWKYSTTYVSDNLNGDMVMVRVVDQDGAQVSQGVTSKVIYNDFSNAVAYAEAKHIARGPRFGSLRLEDRELPAGTGVVATGDEDGVVSSKLRRGNTGEVTLDVQNLIGGQAAQIDVWIDFNRNGTFDANEQVVNSSPVTKNGARVFNVPVPTDASIGDTVMRMRISLASDGDLTAISDSASGEVEDHTIAIGGVEFSTDAGNLLVTSHGSRNDQLSITATATDVQFTFADAVDLSFALVPGATLNGQTVTVPKTAFTGEVRLSTAAGTDAINIQASSNLPAISVDGGDSADSSVSRDILTVTSTGTVTTTQISYESDQTGSAAITVDAAPKTISWSGPVNVNLSLTATTLTVDASNHAGTAKLYPTDVANTLAVYVDSFATMFARPTGSLTVKGSTLDLPEGIAAPISIALDAATIGLGGNVDTTAATFNGDIELDADLTIDSQGTPDGDLVVNGRI
ncbi:MAG TPA: GEVED domain-containing protein, partial [Pirellulaceae bacterium]|nr:GEVED domain-containing protein [Pirellulaceae bacterium]